MKASVLHSAVAGMIAVSSAALAQPRAVDRKALEQAGAAIRSIEIELGNLHSALGVAANSIRDLAAETRFFPIERRLVDADLLFETEDCDRAAILYRDLVDNPAFRGRPGYYKAVFRLSECLFRTRNYVAARRYYQMAATPEAGADYPLAVARLFEIAVTTKDFSGCDRLEALVPSFAETSPEILYAFGKYLYHRGRRVEAETAFARVPAGSASFSRARYFLGVVATRDRRLDAALDHFAAAASAPAAKPDDAEVQALAHLARARILGELERYAEALVAVQQVPATSPIYPESLYDAAWIQLQAGNLAEASRALEILLLTQPSGDLALRASALRGRILTRLEDPEAAQEVYEEISANLTPLANELERMARDPSVLDAYFAWVIARQNEKFHLDVPVSERTAQWLQSDPDMAAITAMFADLARERDELQSGLEMAGRLLWTLQSGGKLVSFPSLKERIVRLMDIENSFLVQALAALDAVERVVRARVAGESGARYEAAVQARHAAAADVRRLPRDTEAYLRREESVLQSYREVERQLFFVESFLTSQQRQILAIEEWLRETRARGDQRLNDEREAEIRRTLDDEKRNLNEVRREADALRENLNREMVTVQSQSELLAEDDAVRDRLWKVLAEESLALEAVSAALDPDTAALAQKAAAIVSRGEADAASVAPLIQNVMEIADRGASELARVVSRERERLQEALSEIEKTRLDSEAFARTDANDVFRRISGRLKDVLLEADLGLVDMAWSQERALSEQLRLMGTERAERLRTLGRVEEMVRKGSPAGGSGSK